MRTKWILAQPPMQLMAFCFKIFLIYPLGESLLCKWLHMLSAFLSFTSLPCIFKCMLSWLTVAADLHAFHSSQMTMPSIQIWRERRKSPWVRLPSKQHVIKIKLETLGFCVLKNQMSQKNTGTYLVGAWWPNICLWMMSSGEAKP